MERKWKLGAYVLKRVAAGVHLPAPWLFESAKRPDGLQSLDILKQRLEKNANILYIFHEAYLIIDRIHDEQNLSPHDEEYMSPGPLADRR